MIFDILTGQLDWTNLIITLLVSVPVVLISLSFHEMAHGYVANKMGDPTASLYGRITMNPLKHLDVLGALSMVFFGIGWAKPVPINPRNFRKLFDAFNASINHCNLNCFCRFHFQR